MRCGRLGRGARCMDYWGGGGSGLRSEGEKEDPLVVVEDGRNGGGFGDKRKENQCWYDVDDVVEGKGRL